MIAAAKLSVKLKHLPEAEAIRIEKVIAEAGLPTKIPPSFDPEAVIERLKMDKKKKDNIIHFVLIKKIGLPFVSGSVTDLDISDVLEEMKA
jgi:3-dehydroquinate synthase